jgi:hypothetical protein
MNAKKKKFIEAYKLNMCNVTDSCKAINISRPAYYKWIKKDKDFQEAIDEAQEETMDWAESQLKRNIERGKEASLFFFMVNRGKGQWVNIQKVEHSPDAGTTAKIDKLLDIAGKILSGGSDNAPK